jgi:hypothetical protein
VSRIHYFGDGYLLDDDGPNRQSTWVCMYNPAPRTARLKFTFYYEEAAPTTMAYRQNAARASIWRIAKRCTATSASGRKSRAPSPW